MRCSDRILISRNWWPYRLIIRRLSRLAPSRWDPAVSGIFFTLVPIAKVISGGFAGAEVLKNYSLRLRSGCTLSGVEGKHCGLFAITSLVYLLLPPLYNSDFIPINSTTFWIVTKTNYNSWCYISLKKSVFSFQNYTIFSIATLAFCYLLLGF